MRIFSSRVLFGISLSANATLLSLLVLVCSGPFLPTGEHFFGLAFIWVFTLPGVFVASGFLSAQLSRYMAWDRAPKRIAFYLGLVVATSALGHLAGWVLLEIFLLGPASAV